MIVFLSEYGMGVSPHTVSVKSLQVQHTSINDSFASHHGTAVV